MDEVRISKSQYLKAKDRVENLVRGHKEGIETFEIAKELHIHPLIVLKAVGELRDEDKVRLKTLNPKSEKPKEVGE